MKLFNRKSSDYFKLKVIGGVVFLLIWTVLLIDQKMTSLETEKGKILQKEYAKSLANLSVSEINRVLVYEEGYNKNRLLKIVNSNTEIRKFVESLRDTEPRGHPNGKPSHKVTFVFTIELKKGKPIKFDAYIDSKYRIPSFDYAFIHELRDVDYSKNEQIKVNITTTWGFACQSKKFLDWLIDHCSGSRSCANRLYFE